jgi:STE24 endopeptidase
MSMGETEIIDPERQQRAKQYAGIKRRLLVLELAVGGIYTIAWLMLRWPHALESGLQNLTTNVWLLVPAFALIFGGIYYLLTLPLSYYSGFILPHRFEQSTQDLRAWIVDQLKGLLVGGLLGVLLLEVIYFVLRTDPGTWWLWAAGILLAFNVILANLAPVLLLPLFFRLEPLSEERADLAERLVRLAEQAGTKVRGVFKIDMSRRTKAANAALTGLGNTRRILLGDTLLDAFSDDEIETVMAHELGHHVHNDIPIGIAVESALTLVGLYLASLVLDWGVTFFSFDGPGDIAGLPLFGLVAGLYGLVTMPLGNAFSRWRERRADRYALEKTEKGEAYASALARLANQNLAEADPELWVEILLYSHPALGKRIEMARNFRG